MANFGPWHSDMITSPAQDGVAITPSDSSNLAAPVRGIYIGVTGNVALTTLGGTSLTFVGCVAGTILPVCAIKVANTNTTATNLIGI